ncbi:MAG: hypothetical protein JW786_00165 [Desulfobacterales bacterium]|nr:hypothetical protein [Desulfobacterales bacterium]
MKSVGQKQMILKSIGIIMVSFLLISGCSGLKQKKDASTSSFFSKQKEKKPVALYYDFQDVLVPGELKIDKKGSFVYRTSGFSAGVLVLTGRVEIGSLIAFFENNMTKDNWRPLSSFKFPRAMMLFEKENRYCVISISDGGFNTHCNIWVAPLMNPVESGLLK